MTWHPIQETFVSGEITPALSSQISSQVYRSGLKTCLNMLPTHTGAVTTRPGLEHVTTIRSNYEGDARVIPIDFGLEQRVVLVLTDLQLHIYSNENFARKGNSALNPSFRDGVQYWVRTLTEYSSAKAKTADYSPTYIGSGDTHWLQVYTPGCYVHPTYGTFPTLTQQTAKIKQNIEIPEHSEPIRIQYDLYAFRAYTLPSDFVYEVEYEYRARVRVTSIDGATTVYDQTHTLARNETLSMNEAIPLLDGYSGPAMIQIDMENTPTEGGEGSGTVYINNMSINFVNLLYDEAATPEIAPLVSPYSSDQLEAIQFVQQPYTNEVGFVHPDVTPWALTRNELGDFTFSPIVWKTGGQGVNPHWVTNPNATDGYPRAAGSNQGRWIMGGTYKEPQSIWATEPGANGWDNVLLPIDPVGDDPLWYSMTTLGYIQWIQGGPKLLHGTSNGEHTVSAMSGIIDSSDLQVVEQSTNGGAHIQSEKVGHEVFYVGANRRDVRTAVYSDELQNYRSDNMTLASPHITRGEVKRLAYGRHPFKIVWCCLRDGTLAAMSYDPGAKMSGWHRHQTAGTVLDTAEGRLGGVDYIYNAVRRSSGDNSDLTLEAMQTYESDKVIAMDRYTYDQADPPTDTITGLERFGNESVWVQTVGKLYGPLTVIEGAVTVPEQITGGYIVGQPFHQEIETMPAIPAPKGGSLGSAKTFSRIGLRLYESSLPTVNGVQYKQKPGKSTPTGWGDYASGTLADYHQQHLGWDYLEPIKVEQDQPQKLTITGIFGKLTDEDI